MSAALAAPLVEGCQEPRFLSVPPAAGYTAAEDALEFVESVDVLLDPWQKLAVRHALAEAEDGRWAAFEFALLVARQNGKGEVIMALELAKLFLLRFGRPPLILHSAHLFPTAQEAFRRIREVVDGSDDLRKEVKRISAAHGEEGIELRDGARLRFMARTISGAGRGFSPTDLYLDEVFHLPIEAVSANMPALSAQKNPQIGYFCSAGYPSSEVLWRIVERGRAGGDPQLAYLEWSVPRGVDIADRDEWLRSNPAVGYRLTLDAIGREYASMPAEEFGRERLSIWADMGAGGLIDPLSWSQVEDRESVADAVVYALDVSMDHAWAALALAGRRTDGLMHISVDDRPGGGTAWVVARCRELKQKYGARFVLDKGGPAYSLVPDLEDAGVDVELMSLADARQACGLFLDAVTQGTLRHRGQADLNAAVQIAQPRPVGEGGPVFGRKSGEITSLNAACFAHWYAVTNGPYSVLNSIW